MLEISWKCVEFHVNLEGISEKFPRNVHFFQSQYLVVCGELTKKCFAFLFRPSKSFVEFRTLLQIASYESNETCREVAAATRDPSQF